MRKIIMTVKVPARAVGNGFNVKGWDALMGPGVMETIIDYWSIKGFRLVSATPVGGSQGKAKEYLLTFAKDLNRYQGAYRQQRLFYSILPMQWRATH